MSYQEYRHIYPGLPVAILEFFDQSNSKAPVGSSNQNQIVAHTVQEFLQYLYSIDKKNGYPQPGPVDLICRKLCDLGYLSSAGVRGGANIDGLSNTYLGMLRDEVSRGLLGTLLENSVYGWVSVYENAQAAVLPIQHETRDGALSLGTCFHLQPNKIVTARHCVYGAKSLSIKGINADVLRKSYLYISQNEALDLALIVAGEEQLHQSNPILLDTAAVLDEILVLGYPNIPGYHPQLAGEKALVSSKFTALRGSVASAPREIFSREDLFLITARVRGGFSGGPVLSTNGGCVGVISRSPASETNGTEIGQRYDELGYGTAIPSSFLAKMIEAAKNRDEEFCILDDNARHKWVNFD